MSLVEGRRAYVLARFGNVAAASVIILSIHSAAPAEDELPPVAKVKIDFVKHIQPILSKKCIRCHGPKRQKSEYRIDSREAAIKGGDLGRAIVPGDSAKSALIRFVSGVDEDVEMPPSGKPLTPAQVGLLRAWIDQGVVYAKAAPKKLTLSERLEEIKASAAEPNEAVPMLIEALKDEDPQVRRASLITLARVGPWAKDAVPALVESLKDPDVEIRSRAASALRGIAKDAAPAVDALVASLRQKEVRRAATKALGSIGRAAVPALIKLLEDKDPAIRRAAAEALGVVGEDAKAAVPALVKRLSDSAPGVRYEAAGALRWMGMEAKAAVPALVETLADGEIRVLAAEALARIGEDAIGALEEALEKGGKVRAGAAKALGLMGKKAKAAVPALLEAFKDKDADVRYEVAMAFQSIGEEAKAAVPALRAALKDEAIRSVAAQALAEVGGGAVGPLTEALKDGDAGVRAIAAQALGRIGTAAKSAAGALGALLKDGDTNVRRSAAVALRSMGKEAKAAVGPLTEALQDGALAATAAQALGNVGADAGAAVAELKSLLGHEQLQVKRSAERALAKIQKEIQAKEAAEKKKKEKKKK